MLFVRVTVRRSGEMTTSGALCSARELKGLPKEGMLYPIVCLADKKQSYTMVALP